MEPSAYKEFHESFMQNNNGTTIEEVFVTIVPVFFTAALSSNLVYIAQPLSITATFAIEFISIVLSTILNVTILNNRIWEITLTLAGVLATAVAKQLYNRIHIAPFVQIPYKRPEYLSGFRAATNFFTTVCILAVDFKCFPRKLAKTETFGFGLMDVGVGLYVFGNGIVAPELYKPKAAFTFNKLKVTLLGCVPLIVLGAARFFTTNQLDYQQHVSEYGVHWSFFLTLAFTKLFSTILIGLLPHMKYIKHVTMAVMFLHELTLQLGFAEFIVDANNTVKRDNFFTANREGIGSISGYVSIYLASVYIGYTLKNDEDDQEKKEFINSRDLFWKGVRLTLITMILWKVTYILKNLLGVSRRLANIGYIFWTLSLGSSIVVLMMMYEIFYYFRAFEQPTADEEDSKVNQKTVFPLIFRAISYNGLAYFLLANLLTGLVNLCYQTLLMDTMMSITILSMYMFSLCVIITFLHVNQIKLKVW